MGYRRVRCAVVVAVQCLCCCFAALPDASWPKYNAGWVLRVIKTYGLELDTEPQWMHLHTSNAPFVGLKLEVRRNNDNYGEIVNPTGRSINVRYTVMGVPVSGWLTPSAASFPFNLSISNPALRYVKDGVADLSVEVRGTARMDYKPWPAFLHLMRGLPLSPLVPIMGGDQVNLGSGWVPGVTRVARTERRQNDRGFPVNPNVTRWQVPPYEADLYMEHLTSPHTTLFDVAQMWWEDMPSHPGLTFIRGMQPYQGEDPRGLDHTKFPYRDGPRGVGWVSAYLQGHVDNQGRFAFVEVGGRLAWLLPDGELITLAGWVTAPGKEPTWIRKDLSAVRGNQVLRGEWPASSPNGFSKPMDVAFDPVVPTTLYVADMDAHCIWKVELVEVVNSRPRTSRVSVLAGSPRVPGYAGGSAANARFNMPYSISFDATRRVLFVSDSGNHAIRKVSLTGQVSTVWGRPDMATVLRQKGVADLFSRAQLRRASALNVTAAQAASGVRPDIFWPAALRVRSDGDLVLFEHSYAYLRRLNPDTHVASILAELPSSLKYDEYNHGWAWLDVDVTGAAGPKDGTYWCMAVAETIPGQEGYHYNEVYAWTPPEGGGSRWIFTGRGGGANPNAWGPRNGVTPPHYPWLVAVDPRGALLVAGMGEHGISRVRLRDPQGDPQATEDYEYWLGQFNEWWYGGMQGVHAYSFSFRFGFGGHNMIGMPDAFQTRTMSDAELLKFYGVPSTITGNAERKRNFLAFIRKQHGPARDAISRAAPDTRPPSSPSNLTAVAGPEAGSYYLRWRLAVDNVAVSGYVIRLAKDADFRQIVSGYNSTFVGNTEVLLLEGLTAGTTYYVGLRALDLAGNQSGWASLRFP
mmetsp:Transcript_17951/g.38548  ORF Transcript_17951/g.38548 Transcript_17951/m.38548 type:complete len:859 (+) Transcript_17951:175-2751(+)